MTSEGHNQWPEAAAPSTWPEAARATSCQRPCAQSPRTTNAWPEAVSLSGLAAHAWATPGQRPCTDCGIKKILPWPEAVASNPNPKPLRPIHDQKPLRRTLAQGRCAEYQARGRARNTLPEAVRPAPTNHQCLARGRVPVGSGGAGAWPWRRAPPGAWPFTEAWSNWPGAVLHLARSRAPTIEETECGYHFMFSALVRGKTDDQVCTEAWSNLPEAVLQL